LPSLEIGTFAIKTPQGMSAPTEVTHDQTSITL